MIGHGIELCEDGRVIVDPNLFYITPQKPFDRSYLDRYNKLNCKPDVEAVCKFSAKQVTNVMAAWTWYKNVYGRKDMKEHCNDASFVVYAPNKRMATFLRHMTKWQVFDKKLPTREFVYFGINPDRKELQDISYLSPNWAIIIGTKEEFLDRYGMWISSFEDQRILGPNKTVSVI